MSSTWKIDSTLGENLQNKTFSKNVCLFSVFEFPPSFICLCLMCLLVVECCSRSLMKVVFDLKEMMKGLCNSSNSNSCSSCTNFNFNNLFTTMLACLQFLRTADSNGRQKFLSSNYIVSTFRFLCLT